MHGVACATTCGWRMKRSRRSDTVAPGSCLSLSVARSALTGRPPSRALRQERHSPDVGQRHTRSNEDVRQQLGEVYRCHGQWKGKADAAGRRAGTGANAVIPRNGLCPRVHPAACERTHRTKTHRSYPRRPQERRVFSGVSGTPPRSRPPLPSMATPKPASPCRASAVEPGRHPDSGCAAVRVIAHGVR